MYREMLVLSSLLIEGPRYGAQLKVIPGIFTLNNNTIYTMLKKFTDQGHVTVLKEAGPRGQILYQITTQGTHYLIELINSFSKEEAGSWLDFLMRIRMYRILSKEEMLQIMEKRRLYLRHAYDYMFAIRHKVMEDHAEEFLIISILGYAMERSRNELGYLEELEKLLDIHYDQHDPAELLSPEDPAI